VAYEYFIDTNVILCKSSLKPWIRDEAKCDTPKTAITEERNDNMLKVLLLFIQTVFSEFVIISPSNEPTKALAFEKEGRIHSFTVVDRNRMKYALVYSAVPLDVMLEDGSHELYFGGHKMCFYDVLHPCAFLDQRNGRWEFVKTKRGLYMLRNKGMCMHVNKHLIFMEGCNPSLSQQNFIIAKVNEPTEVLKRTSRPKSDFQWRIAAENERSYRTKSRNPPAKALF
jgi:hypothetical protein